MIALIFVLLAVYATIADAAYCSGSPDAGERVNNFPIHESELRLIRSVPNAKLLEAGPPNITFPVVHL